ncbi:MAG: Sec-independent protein translocase protein TatB [bacterium]
MFDIGFFELMLIAVVALLVVGPERLPVLAKTTGLWIGKAKRFVSNVRDDIEQELKADELKKVLEQQAKSNPVHEIIEDTQKQFQEIKSETEAAFSDPDKSTSESNKG